jgi:hypothetical protein
LRTQTANGVILSSSPDPSPEEAAAIVAAIEHFMRATAPVAGPPLAGSDDAWRRTALLEGVARDLDDNGPGSAHPWMRTP